MPDEVVSRDSELQKRIVKLLSAQLCLQIKAKFEKIPDQVDFLSDFALDSREIATVLRITPSHASKELSILKKAAEKSKVGKTTKPGNKAPKE